MPTKTPSAKLPAELFDEKSFYSLGGASGAVLLIAWVIKIIIPDLSVQALHVIVLGLSESFAIIIMLQNKNAKIIKWLFAFLNGLLIFLNVNGVNQITYSSSSNPIFQDTAVNKYPTNFTIHSDNVQQASLFPIPGMTNWWPDKNLIKQNEELIKKNEILEFTNIKLQSIIKAGSTSDNKSILSELDNFNNLTKKLELQLSEKQKQLDECNYYLQVQGGTSQQLNDCIKQRNAKSDSLLLLLASYNILRGLNEKLQKRIEIGENEKNTLRVSLDECDNLTNKFNQTIISLNAEIENLNLKIKNHTLTEHIQQECNKNSRSIIRRPPGYIKSPDDYLEEQDFWKSFCSTFNDWSTPIK